MMSVGHMLDHVPDHVLDHMIIGLVTTALHRSCDHPIVIWRFKKLCFQRNYKKVFN